MMHSLLSISLNLGTPPFINLIFFWTHAVQNRYQKSVVISYQKYFEISATVLWVPCFILLTWMGTWCHVSGLVSWGFLVCLFACLFYLVLFSKSNFTFFLIPGISSLFNSFLNFLRQRISCIIFPIIPYNVT